MTGMTGPMVLIGFDGSPDAAEAIAVGRPLFPAARAAIAHVWTPPLMAHPSLDPLRRAGRVDGLIELDRDEGV